MSRTTIRSYVLPIGAGCLISFGLDTSFTRTCAFIIGLGLFYWVMEGDA